MPYNYWRSAYYSITKSLRQQEYRNLVSPETKTIRKPDRWVWSSGGWNLIKNLTLEDCNKIIKHIKAGNYCSGQEHKLYSILDKKKKLKKSGKKVLTKDTESATLNVGIDENTFVQYESMIDIQEHYRSAERVRRMSQIEDSNFFF